MLDMRMIQARLTAQSTYMCFRLGVQEIKTPEYRSPKNPDLAHITYRINFCRPHDGPVKSQNVDLTVRSKQRQTSEIYSSNLIECVKSFLLPPHSNKTCSHPSGEERRLRLHTQS